MNYLFDRKKEPRLAELEGRIAELEAHAEWAETRIEDLWREINRLEEAKANRAGRPARSGKAGIA